MFAEYRGHPKQCEKCGTVVRNFAPTNRSNNHFQITIKQKAYFKRTYRLCNRCWCGFINKHHSTFIALTRYNQKNPQIKKNGTPLSLVLPSAILTLFQTARTVPL